MGSNLRKKLTITQSVLGIKFFYTDIGGDFDKFLI